MSGGGKTGRIKLWGLGSLEYVGVLDGHSGPVNRLAFYAGVILSASSDRTVRVWSIQGEGECITTLAHGDVIKGLALWSPAPGKAGEGFVASAGGLSNRLIVWGAADKSS